MPRGNVTMVASLNQDGGEKWGSQFNWRMAAGKENHPPGNGVCCAKGDLRHGNTAQRHGNTCNTSVNSGLRCLLEEPQTPAFLTHLNRQPLTMAHPRASFASSRDYIPGVTPGFNPKAVQNAAQKPPPRRQLPTGPFIDAVPAGNGDLTAITNRYHIPAAMSMEKHLQRQSDIQIARRTVRALKASRWIMLAARMMQLVAAMGLLALLIMLRGMDWINSWVMRVPPAVAIVHVLYAIYHNVRDPKDRPPKSSANYALFAAASDCCLIPFYAFIALWTWQQHQQMLADPLNTDNWVTVFDKTNTDLSQLFVFIVFCTACAGGGLMALSIVLGMFIAVVFRRISHLPPDMNPLDNSSYTSLTARPSSKRFSKSSNASEDTLEKPAADVSPRRSVPFLEVRTKNGSLSWEYTKDADRAKSNIDLPDLIPNATNDAPLLPPAHRFSDFGGSSRRSSVDSRRNSVDQRMSIDTRRNSVDTRNSLDYRRNSRSQPGSPHRKTHSINGYYSDREEPSTPPRAPRHAAYKQRPAEWWTGNNAFPAFPGSNRYSAVSQTDASDNGSTFSDARASRNTFGLAPARSVGRPGTPPNIPSYAGSICTATGTAPSIAGSTGTFPAHMSTPPGVQSGFTLGAFASDLAPRPLSFPNNRSAPGSPRRSGHQSRDSVGRLPTARIDTAPASPNGVLGSYARPPPQTSLTPPAASPTKAGVFIGRAVDTSGNNFYTRDGLMTPASSVPSSPVKNPVPRPQSSGSSVRDKKSKYEMLAQNSPGRSISGEKRKKARAKQQEKERRDRRKSGRLDVNDVVAKEEEREKEAGTRVLSNSGADFAHMFGGGGAVRGRVISGSQVV
ncbi:hypothetical protein Dda_8354 [Drechslerella dactyloides]|uniref:Uncharacterized protein n=1 Tax=Drechslerella dactyloides TaxID=74499 RepID=A0AAD6NFS2_DREDA|nr:hypothetical protein Dda_8354 [Drechslerella dactyloides]